MARRILLLEPHADGHRGPYLRWMIEGLANHGLDLTVVTLPKALLHPSLADIKGRYPNQLEVIADGEAESPSNARGGLLGQTLQELRYWRLFRRWYLEFGERSSGVTVFLPYLDYCLYGIGLLGSPFAEAPWAGLTMRPSFHYAEVGVVAPRPVAAWHKRALFFRMLRSRHLKALLTIDETLVDYIDTKGRAQDQARLRLLSQPADCRTGMDGAAAKESLGLSPSTKYILVYGSITHRKGVAELLRALSEPVFPDAVSVLLAGRVGADVQALMNTDSVQRLIRQGRVRVMDRFIGAGEESTVFAAADIIWLGYQGHYGPSGVLVQAAQARRPVVACREGVIGWQTTRYQLGEVVSAKNPAAVAESVRRLSETSPCRVWGGRFSVAFESNTVDRAVSALVGALTDD